ncbi:MAG: MMPL family transporter [Blautia sp.]|nr:MMPL family transporter [Blautia sp.]
MQRLAEYIVRYRNRILAVMLVLGLACAIMIPMVRINTDMTAYLPETSPMKQGIDVIKEEFDGLASDNTVRVMFTDLPEDEEESVHDTLKNLPNVSSVDFEPDSEDYKKGNHTLYIIHSPYDFHSSEMKSLEKDLQKNYKDYCQMVYTLDNSTTDSLPLGIVMAALVIIMAVLILMSPSFTEPVLFMITIGIAVAINTGTNFFLGSVSQTTHAIGALLQLVLSLDYSVMVMEQYRQAKESTDRIKGQSKHAKAAPAVIKDHAYPVEEASAGIKDNAVPAEGASAGINDHAYPAESASARINDPVRHTKKTPDERMNDCQAAMSVALLNSFRPVLGSSVTTMVGLLMLVFMSFRIGADLGIVLAKGVFTSLLCVFTVMPALVLLSDSLIEKTSKPVPEFPLDKLGALSARFGKGILVFFAALLVLVLYLKGSTEITYTMPTPSQIDSYFTRVNRILLLYSNEDEDTIPDIEEFVMSCPENRSVMTYADTIGKAYTTDELTDMLNSYDMDLSFDDFMENMPLQMSAENAAAMLIDLYNASEGREKGSPVTIMELLDFITGGLSENPLYGAFITDEVRTKIEEFKRQIETAEKSLVSPDHSMMIIETVLPDESEETMRFIEELEEHCGSKLIGDHYLIGSAPMAYEMSKTFREELDRISILTAAAVFIVVLITFRKLLLSVVLVALIQTAVYITVVVMGIQGQSMYYLAFLMVQSILMGATIDYAIVLTNYYREGRRSMPIEDSMKSAYRNSIRTILTSGLIIVFATIILGYAFEDPSIGQICHTIAKGTAAALILIIFILPGMLCALDRFVKTEKHI